MKSRGRSPAPHSRPRYFILMMMIMMMMTMTTMMVMMMMMMVMVTMMTLVVKIIYWCWYLWQTNWPLTYREGASGGRGGSQGPGPGEFSENPTISESPSSPSWWSGSTYSSEADDSAVNLQVEEPHDRWDNHHKNHHNHHKNHHNYNHHHNHHNHHNQQKSTQIGRFKFYGKKKQKDAVAKMNFTGE